MSEPQGGTTAQSPRVRNRYHGDAGEGAAYIGRGTPYGNPYVIGRHGTRDEVVAKHRVWLADQPHLVEQVRRHLAGRDLVCFCAPKACHGDFTLLVANVSEADLPAVLEAARA